MEKLITIDDREIQLYILQVFDDKQGYINEHILAVDLSNIYYEKNAILELLKLIKKKFPTIRPVFYQVSSDNYNNVYISIIGGKTEDHSIKEINASLSDYEKYALTIGGLHSKYE
ncbi:MAG: hypothetical protein ABIP51_05815 [Bacteroidia bacterium]